MPNQYTGPSPLADRFWKFVNKTDTCWLWTGSKGTDGYGMTGIRQKKLRAHRVSWELVNGPIPLNLSVLHRCDTPLCIRPDHLFLGTRADNAHDKVAKGRQPRGEYVGPSKLTANNVHEIRSFYAAGGVSQRALAAMYNVSQAAIAKIVRRETWRHVG